MIEKRSKGARRSRITDDNIRDWVESEAFESRNAASMSILESKLNESSAAKDYPAHGSVEENRPDGVFRGMSVQLNGMVTRQVMNRKARLLTSAIKKYEVQFVGIGEVGVNWKKANRKRLLSLLPELTGEARAMTANNTTENVAVHQQGGVATLALGEIINYYKKGTKDFRHLGRWTSFILQSIQGHRTRIVQAYGVRANRSNILGSVYQQHVRYIQQNLHENVSPRQLFESDLLWQLSVWRALGDRIILIMDANCHVLTGKLSRALTVEGIDLKEITKEHIGSLCPNSHSSGSEQIDGVWATPDITVTAVQEKGESFCQRSRSELKTIIGFKDESTRLIRCKRLTLINSIRDDNFVEGSLLASISAETADTPAKRLFASLEEVNFETFDHKAAIQDLLEAVQWLFLQPRAMYITQYMYILTAKDLKKSQVQNNLSTLASDSAERMNSEQNNANPPTTEKTIGTTVDNSVDKRMNKHKKETNEATASILARMELIEQEFKLERSKRLESERELQDLKASLESKEEVPSSNSGTETIDSERSKPHHPISKVKFHKLPPSNNNHRNPPKPKHRRKHHQEPGEDIHGRAAKKRRKKRDEATDAEQDTLNVSETTSIRLPLDSSKSKKKSKNKVWKRQKDTRKH
eukprot:scaffold39105_cov59-Cyclotella_meneghiniana.AAC.3